MKVVVNGFGGPNPSTTVEDEYLLGLAGEQVTVLDGNNNWQWTNVYANGRVMATYDPSGTQFTLGDWLGTKRVVANVTAPLTVSTTQCTSLPYGDGLSCTGADANQLHFTGKERDQESTNDYFLARYYASNTAGRFLTPDSSNSPQAMPYADLSNPQSFNRYVYLNDNPVGGVDADGHQITDNNGKTCGADNVKDHLTHGQADALCANATTSAGTKQQQSVKHKVLKFLGKHQTSVKVISRAIIVGTVISGAVDGGASEAAVPEEVGGEAALEAAIDTESEVAAVNANKLSHIFDNAQHDLGDLVGKFGGSQEQAFNAIQSATETAVQHQGLSGVFETTVNVAEETVTVRGAVVDGVVKIGTAFK